MLREIRDYLAHQEALGSSARTIETYRFRLRRFARFARSGRVTRLQDVTASLARAYHGSMAGAGLTAASRLSQMTTLRAFLGWAFDRQLMPVNLAPRVEVPRRPRSLPPRPLSPGQVERLLDLPVGETLQARRERAMLEMLYGCGLRRQELVTLNIGDVDFQHRRLFVRGKGGKERLLPVNERALAAVSGYLHARGGEMDADTPVFVAHRGRHATTRRLGTTAINRSFRRLSRASGKRVYPHLLRHCFAVHLLKNGADLRHVQALLGHESPETTAIYLGLAKQDIKRAYDAAVEALLKGRKYPVSRRNSLEASEISLADSLGRL